jgi:hypothetical protein
MWDSPVAEQYDEGVSEDSRRVDIDGLEEARCAALVQSGRYLEGIRRYHSPWAFGITEPIGSVLRYWGKFGSRRNRYRSVPKNIRYRGNSVSVFSVRYR